MNTPPSRGIDRRGILKLAAAAGILVPSAVSLSSCAAGGSGAAATASAAAGTATNPFGVAAGSAIDAVVFKGGYGTDYVDFAGTLLAKTEAKPSLTVTATTEIAPTMQPRFVAGNPPDLLDNSGAKLIPMPTIIDQLADLDDLIAATNLDGDVIKDVVYPGVLEDGVVDGKQKFLNYVMTVYAMWYSASLLKAQGWTVPTTWDEMMALGEQAKAQNKYLFLWGKEAASYWLIFLLDAAIKEGGSELRVKLGNLEKDAWHDPAMVKTAQAMEAIIKAGYVKPGGEGTQFTAAQAGWSKDQEAIFYHSGSWIENEMKDQTAAGFEMTAGLVPSVTASPKYTPDALHAEAGEPFIVPAKAKNVAGGKETLRAMLSKEAATNFAKTRLSSTIVKGTVPEGAFGSTALATQIGLLEGAGKNAFSLSWLTIYGLWSADSNTWFNSFLSGRMDAATLLNNLQDAADKVAADATIKKFTVS